jgi:sodium/proline symporter
VAAVDQFGRHFLNPFASGAEDKFGTLDIISALGWGLGYFGMPHILVRFMGIRSNHEVALSRRIATIWVIFAFLGAVLVGALGKAYLAPEGGLAAGQQETVFVVSLLKMFPAVIAGLFLCGIFAAAMSTADSQLLVASSAFSRDVFHAFIKKDASNKTLLLMSRLTVVAVAVVGFLLALDPNSSIFALVSYAWAGFGAAFGPIVLLTLFWKKLSRNGALAGIIGGGATVVLWKNFGAAYFELPLYEIIPGFAVCLLLAIGISLLRPAAPEVQAEFRAYTELND